jgi:hypothetical protein
MIADICNRANELSSYNNSITVVRMAVHSVCSFSSRTICAIMDVYHAIQDSLSNKPVVQKNQTLSVF